MAGIRCSCALVLNLLLTVAAAAAADLSPAAPPELYDQPVLAVDPGMHTATIWRAAVDVVGRWAVTGSQDKTVRVWSLDNGLLLPTIRLPAGPGEVGKVRAVAMSPDGALIAAGGWTRATEAEQIYLFNSADGALIRRIEGLPDVVNNLAFSPDGYLLVATLFSGGLRIYSRERNWTEVARDVDYGDQSYGAALAPDGRLATTGYDGKVRLYGGNLEGDIRPVVAITAPGHGRPHGVAFSPDGSRLAVGYIGSAAVTLLDGGTLTRLPVPGLSGVDNGTLSSVAWSRDGQTLFAAGRYNRIGNHLVLAWSDAGNGARRILSAGQDTVMGLVPLPEGDLLVATADPWLARLRTDGSVRWAHGPPQADFRDQANILAVSSDGTRIDFGFQQLGKVPARFDLVKRTLKLNPLSDGQTAGPRQSGLPIIGWRKGLSPTLGGWPLPLEPNERSRSLAVHPAGDRFDLGTNWSLRTFDSKGATLEAYCP